MHPSLKLRVLVREVTDLTLEAQAASRARIAASCKDDRWLAEATARAEEAIAASRHLLERASR